MLVACHVCAWQSRPRSEQSWLILSDQEAFFYDITQGTHRYPSLVLCVTPRGRWAWGIGSSVWHSACAAALLWIIKSFVSGPGDPCLYQHHEAVAARPSIWQGTQSQLLRGSPHWPGEARVLCPGVWDLCVVHLHFSSIWFVFMNLIWCVFSIPLNKYSVI